MSKSKIVPPLFNTIKHFRNQTKDFSFIVDQTQDLFIGTPGIFRFLLSNPSQSFEIDAMVTFLWLIKRVCFFVTHTVQ